MYAPDVLPIFKEGYRVLKSGGGFYYKSVNRMPYRSTDFDEQGDWVEYGHTM